MSKNAKPDVADIRLSWGDLLIEPSPESAALLSGWAWKVQGRVGPLYLNRFGSWFFLRPSGVVEYLDVLDGHVETVAGSHAEFMEKINTPTWQERYLLSPLVLLLHREKKVPGSGECYALVPHPVIGGPSKFDPANVMVMPLGAWQSICRQVLGGPP